MKNFKKAITVLMVVLILLSCAACSNGTGSNEANGGGNQANVNTSSEIYEFAINLLGSTYSLPADLAEFKTNGWTYANNDNPESKDVKANGYATCDVLKDGKKITLTVINLGTNTKKFADCKVGSVDCTFSTANDMTFNLANKLSATKDTTVEDVTGKFGKATKTINGDSGTTLRYEKETYVYYVFTFNAEGKLTYVDIRNWKTEDESTGDAVDLGFLRDYVAPNGLTDNYADYIFKLEGKMYQLPAPVSSFTDNGWAIKTYPESIAAGNEITSGLVMTKGNWECCKVKHEEMKYMKKIVKAHISFSDGYCGRSITLDGNTLSWKNTHYPGPLPTPDYDCSEKKIELSDVDVQLLSNELSNVDISECISDSVIDHPAGASYSIFTCTYEDGSEIEYKTRFKPAPAFELLKRILNRRFGLPDIPIIPPLPLDDDAVILDVPKTDEDVIKIDPNITDILYPDTLKLLVCSSSKTITLQKACIEVGRSTEADLNFGADNKYLARRHATFMFSNGKWYLVDNNSTNGTYINGVKLQPGKKYQLAADDEIVFAGYTKLIFYKTPWAPTPPIVPPMPPHKPPSASSKAPVPPLPVAPIQLGTVIDGKYKLERILAVGPHTVYLAAVEGEDKKVAIKVEDISELANQTIIADIKESFELHKAIKHPDVPSMLELIQTSKYIYLVMDYLDGETLDRILDKSGPMESKRVAVVGRNIAKILKSMHELNPPIVCRDVKPSNIMIHNGLDVSMFDFGIAMRYYDDGREDEHIVGTVGYAAPEQYEGHARPESDIYGLGMTLYYMLTKDNPKTPGFTHRSIRELNSKAAPELERIVEKCIEPDYKNRYRSCDPLIRDLDHFINGGTSAWLSKLFRKK